MLSCRVSARRGLSWGLTPCRLQASRWRTSGCCRRWAQSSWRGSTPAATPPHGFCSWSRSTARWAAGLLGDAWRPCLLAGVQWSPVMLCLHRRVPHDPVVLVSCRCLGSQADEAQAQAEPGLEVLAANGGLPAKQGAHVIEPAGPARRVIDMVYWNERFSKPLTYWMWGWRARGCWRSPAAPPHRAVDQSVWGGAAKANNAANF